MTLVLVIFPSIFVASLILPLIAVFSFLCLCSQNKLVAMIAIKATIRDTILDQEEEAEVVDSVDTVGTEEEVTGTMVHFRTINIQSRQICLH